MSCTELCLDILCIVNVCVIFATRQEALQFYDTPRSVREALSAMDTDLVVSAESILDVGGKTSCCSNNFAGPYGNYDIPHAGMAPIPVFRKQCGCIMKLVPEVSHSQCATDNQGSVGEHGKTLYTTEIDGIA